MNLKIILSILTCQFISFAVSGQYDYVVTLKGDTLTGEIKLITTGKIDHIQLHGGSKKINFTAVQVKATKFENEIYHPVQLGDNIRLMILLKAGFLSLYGYKVENQTTYSGRLLRKMSGAYLDIPTIKFRSAVLNFIDDCEASTQKINDRELGRNDLEKIVNEYNQCMDEKTKQRFLEDEIKVDRDYKISRLLDFKQRIESRPLDNKLEVIGLLDDILLKIESDKTIPAYQKDALQEYLKTQLDLRESLVQLLSLLQ